MSSDRALALLASLVLEDGRRWGDVALPWQWADARAVLEAERRLHYLTRPRGASKTTDLAGIGIAALVEQLPPASRSYGVAADRDQGQLLVDAAGGFVARTPGLETLLRVDTWRLTALHSGATLDVLAADAAGAWGRKPHLLIVDERAQWNTTPEPERLWSALFSALPKVPTSRLVVLTTAGDPAHPAGKLIVRARKSKVWRVNEVPGPCPWIAEADLAEQRAELTASQYARLHLNRWTASEDRLTSVEDLRACVTLDGPLDPVAGLRYAVGVDVGLKRDRTVLTVAHAERLPDADSRAARRVVLDRQAVWQGSRLRPVSLDAVEAYALELHRQFHRPTFVVDPWQAAQLMQRLKARGVSVVEFPFTAQSVGRLAQRLHQLLRARALALPDDEELIDELANVRLRETSPGVLRMDHDAAGHDDRAVSLALAAFHLTEQPTFGPARSFARQIADARSPGVFEKVLPSIAGRRP